MNSYVAQPKRRIAWILAATFFLQAWPVQARGPIIPEAEQMELVDLMWNAPEADMLTVEPVFQFDRDWLPEVMGFVPCTACHELTARAYLRVVGAKHVCIPCSGYER